jgi:hypothetical protein
VGLANRYEFCLKVAVLSLWGALSDERSGLSLVSHCQQYLFIVKFFFLSFHFFVCVLHVTHVYIYIQDLSQPRLSTADHAPSFVVYVTTAV